jgi:tRNA modification GTPase
LADQLDALEKEIRVLLSGYQRGQVIKDGWRVAIIGKPNVGKSSLMNALLRHDRVIVSSIPGTTRDAVEEALLLDGQLFRLVDTAGVRTSHDEIEKAGIARSRRAAEQAHIILFISDQSQRADDLDHTIARECLKFSTEAETNSAATQKRIIHVRNKIDLPRGSDAFQMPAPVDAEVFTSAKTGEGVSELENTLCWVTQRNRQVKGEEIVLTNLRHKQCLEKALASLHCARQSLAANISAEFVAADLREVIHQIGVLVGEVTTEEILGEIFSHFCIGK